MGWGSSVAVSDDIGCRFGSDPTLLWLWHKPAAVAPIRPEAWEFPCATDVAPIPPKKRERERWEHTPILAPV